MKQDHRHRVEGGGVEQQRGLHAEAADDEPGEARADRGAGGEGDVEQGVAGPQLAGRLEQRDDHRPGQRAPGEGEGAVDRRQRDHRGEREVVGEQGETGERGGLAAVDHRQREARRRPLAAGDEQRRQQGGEEAGAEEEAGRRQGAVGAFEDEDREGDDAHPVAELVDRVAGRQASERLSPQGVDQARATHPPWTVVRFLHNFSCRCTSFREVVLKPVQHLSKFCVGSAQQRASAIKEGLGMSWRH